MNKFALLQCQLVPQNNLLDSVKSTTRRCIQYLTKKHHAIPVVHNQEKEKERVFSRHCPSPDLINEYLSAISNEPSTLTSVSTICLSCYKSAKETCRHETDLVVEDLLEEHNDEIYVDDSDDDLDHFRSEEMDKDEKLRALMEFVFGDSSDEEAL